MGDSTSLNHSLNAFCEMTLMWGTDAKISKSSEHQTYVWAETTDCVRHFCRGHVQGTEMGEGSIVRGCKGEYIKLGRLEVVDQG